MPKLSNLLWLSFLLSLLTLGFESISLESFAQIRGEDSDRFFRQGNEVMEQQIRELQRESVRQQQEAQAQNDDNTDDIKEDNEREVNEGKDFEEETDKKEKELETELQMNQSSDIEIKETPDNPTALDDNVPEAPEQEIKIEN